MFYSLPHLFSIHNIFNLSRAIQLRSLSKYVGFYYRRVAIFQKFSTNNAERTRAVHARKGFRIALREGPLTRLLAGERTLRSYY